mmetsp:Transcript_35234/g.87891  ORF Transcript_35234/g.87891 Transcript_35234/m.87891 type:complete len:221 (-) Transcript_35234:836-1498(-)
MALSSKSAAVPACSYANSVSAPPSQTFHLRFAGHASTARTYAPRAPTNEPALSSRRAYSNHSFHTRSFEIVSAPLETRDLARAKRDSGGSTHSSSLRATNHRGPYRGSCAMPCSASRSARESRSHLCSKRHTSYQIGPHQEAWCKRNLNTRRAVSTLAVRASSSAPSRRGRQARSTATGANRPSNCLAAKRFPMRSWCLIAFKSSDSLCAQCNSPVRKMR